MFGNVTTFKRAVREGIPLEQEPCVDAISRQAVFDLPRIKTHNHWGNVIKESVDIEDVRQLPPVTPAEKQQPCEELDFVQPHNKLPVGLKICNMREATQGERAGIQRYIDSIVGSCEDCISRQEVLDMLEDINVETEGVGFYYKHYIEYIKQLPSVTPKFMDVDIQKMQEMELAEIQEAYELGKAEQPKIGHWIAVGDHFWKCSECRCCEISKSNWCPNCGAKMEVEE
jgi:hypothetical protein